MIDRPVLAPALSVARQDGRLLVSSPNGYTVLEDPLCLALQPLLTGEHTAGDIARKMGLQFPPAEVYFTLMQWEDEGLIVEAEPGASAEAPAIWRSLGLDTERTRTRLASHPLHIEASETITALLNRTLEQGGVRLASEASQVLLVVSDYLEGGLEARLLSFRHSGVAVLLVRLGEGPILVGPALYPDRGPCPACLLHRLRLNRPDVVFAQGEPTTPAKPPALVAQLGAGLVAFEVLRWLVTPEAFEREPYILELAFNPIQTTRHPVARRPQCPTCGDPALARCPVPIRLEAGRVVHRANGFRDRTAVETYKAHEHLVSPLTGLVRSVTRVESGSPELCHAYTVGHVSRGRHHSIESLRLATRDQSGGKGKTDEQARASGLCEALERTSAVHEGDPPALHAPFAGLDRRAIHPRDLLLFSEAQYAGRDAWNAGLHGYFQHVAEPCSEETPIDWTEAWSLTREAPVLVPSSSVYYGYEGVGTRYAKADSNGLAAGNTLEEAILQGFLELAERDAVAIWWYNRTRQPGVDLDRLRDPYLDRVRDYHHTLGRDLWVLDLTHDLAIPTYVAVSRRRDGPAEEILLGFGAHLDAHTALTRAVLEVNQSLPALLRPRAERTRQLAGDFDDALNWWDHATLADHPYLAPASIQPLNSPPIETLDLADTVYTLVSRAAGLGFETLALDMTRPDIGLPVARVIVPGLRHFWRRLAPGRLYDVPVAQGRQPDRLTESELNPISLFL